MKTLGNSILFERKLLARTVVMAMLCITLPALAQDSWEESDYDLYDYQTFFELPVVNEPIDLNKINYSLLNAAIFYGTNRVRINNNLPPGEHSSKLEKAASDHSFSMVKKDFFSHTGKVKGKKKLRDRTNSVGIEGGTIAENIAISFVIDYESGKPVYKPSQNGGFFSYKYRGEPILIHTYKQLAERVLEQWMNSPGHRANILLGLKYIGCGAALIPLKNQDQFPKLKITQNFSSVD